MGATVDLDFLSASNLFLVLCLSQFSIQSLLSLVDLFIDLVALFLYRFLYIYIFFFFFSLFVSLYMYASLCDFCLCRFAFTICPRVLSVWGFFCFLFLAF